MSVPSLVAASGGGHEAPRSGESVHPVCTTADQQSTKETESKEDRPLRLSEQDLDQVTARRPRRESSVGSAAVAVGRCSWDRKRSMGCKHY